MINECLDIHVYRKKIVEANKFAPLEDRTAFIHDIMLNGITYQNNTYKTTFVRMENPLSRAGFTYNYYFICPLCEKRAIKLYYHLLKGYCCSKCAERKSSKSGNNYDFSKLQKDFQYLYEGKMTPRKRSLVIKNISSRFNNLSEIYKETYSNMAFKELMKWCTFKLVDKTLDAGYKKAVKDFCEILKSIKKILIKTELKKKK